MCKTNNINIIELEIEKSFDSLIEVLKKNNVFNVYSLYITTGYEKDMLLNLLKKLKANNILYNNYLDSFYKDIWCYCDKGYFHFKKNFDKLFNKI